MNKYLEKIATKLPSKVKTHVRTMLMTGFDSRISKKDMLRFKNMHKSLARQYREIHRIEPSNPYHRANALIHKIIGSRIKV